VSEIVTPYQYMRNRIASLESQLRTLTARLRDVVRERDKWRRIRTPTHGPCCTCQGCGLDYDSCRCDLDEVVDDRERLHASLTTLRTAAECARDRFAFIVAVTADMSEKTGIDCGCEEKK
jgi:hypothetical protein